MKNKPMVSVAVSFYNQERFITETLSSVLNQKTNFPYEIVIGEDCSRDDSKTILSKFQQEHSDKIRIIYNPKNLGVVLNVKSILDNCQGKYIALLGGDDFFSSEDKLQKQYDFLENNLEYGFVHSDAKLLFEKNAQTPQLIESAESHFKLNIKTGHVYEDLIQKCYIIACTAFFKRDIYLQNAQLEHWHQLGFLMEDFPLWLSFARSTKFGYIKESLATYRIANNTVSRPNDPSKNFKFWLSSTKISFYFLEKYGASKEIRNKVLRKNYLFYLEYALYFSNRNLAKEAFEYFQRIGDKRFIYRLYYWGANSKVAWFLLKVSRKFFKSLQIISHNK